MIDRQCIFKLLAMSFELMIYEYKMNFKFGKFHILGLRFYFTASLFVLTFVLAAAFAHQAQAEIYECIHIKTSISPNCDTECACLSPANLVGATLTKTDGELDGNAQIVLPNGDMVNQSWSELNSTYISALWSPFKLLPPDEFQELFNRGSELGLESSESISCEIKNYFESAISKNADYSPNEDPFAQQAVLYAQLRSSSLAALTCEGNSIGVSFEIDSSIPVSTPTSHPQAQDQKSSSVHTRLEAANTVVPVASTPPVLVSGNSIERTYKMANGKLELLVKQNKYCDPKNSKKISAYAVQRMIDYQSRHEIYYDGQCQVYFQLTVLADISLDLYKSELQKVLQENF